MRAFQFTPSPLIFLLVLLALILTILPASAYFSNPSFEAGNLSGYSVSVLKDTGSCIADTSTSMSYVTDGAYSARFRVKGAKEPNDYGGYNWYSGAVFLSQNVDLTDKSSLSFDAYQTSGYSSTYFYVYINNVYKYSSSNAGWHYPVIDVSGYSGICEVKIMIASGDAYENNVYIDNIRLDGLLEPEPEPDVPVYYLNDEVYFSQYSYSYNQTPRLYFDMTDYVDTIGLRDNLDPFLQDPDNYLSWLEEFIGYWVTYYEVRFYEADYYDGRFYDVTSYPFHSYDISEIDYDSVGTEYYYDVFDPLRGRWIRGELVRHVEYYYSPFPTVITGYYVGSVDTVIDKDYAYCYDQGETEYQPPEEEPEIQQPEQPNPTQPNSTIEYPVVPAYNSTYTPPQSQEGNETTVGTSFLDGYYQTVDSIFNPINVTMSAVVSFVTSPLDIISSSVFQVNGYAAGTFDTALFYISPFGLFFTVIFNAIPDDAEIVIMFALICNLILIVLRWK